MHPFADLLICLRFFSRLPVPTTPREAELGTRGLGAAAAMVPLAGAVVGLVPAAVLFAADLVGLPALPASALAIATLVLASGALHEDALADCVDGFGGGRTRDHKLEIMRDSRIGAFGTCAIVLSLMIRIAALSALVEARPWLGAAALLVAASVSRTLCLLPLRMLPPARALGLGAAAGVPSNAALATAALLAIAVSLTLLSADVGLGHIAAGAGASLGGVLLMCAIAYRQIGGQTGDVIGASQQVAECLFFLALAAD